MPGLLERKVRILVPLLPRLAVEGALLAAELASEIEWAKARMVKPDGYERRGRHRRARHPACARRGRRRVPRRRAREAQARSRRLRRSDLGLRGCPRTLTPSSPRPNVGGSVTSSSTSSRMRAPRSSGSCGVARRPQRPLRGRRPRPGDLRLRRRRRVVPGRLPPLVPPRAVPRRRVRPPRQQLPIDAAGGRGRRRGARSTGSASRGARRPARRPPARVPRVRHRRGRSEGRRPGTARRRECAPLVVADGRPLPRQRGSRRSSKRPSPARGCPSASAAAAGSSTVPR